MSPRVKGWLAYFAGSAIAFYLGIRYADAGSVRLTLNPDRSVTMRVYGDTGKIECERRQSLDDRLSTLWDY